MYKSGVPRLPAQMQVESSFPHYIKMTDNYSNQMHHHSILKRGEFSSNIIYTSLYNDLVWTLDKYYELQAIVLKKCYWDCSNRMESVRYTNFICHFVETIVDKLYYDEIPSLKALCIEHVLFSGHYYDFDIWPFDIAEEYMKI